MLQHNKDGVRKNLAPLKILLGYDERNSTGFFYRIYIRTINFAVTL